MGDRADGCQTNLRPRGANGEAIDPIEVPEPVDPAVQEPVEDLLDSEIEDILSLVLRLRRMRAGRGQD